MQTIGDLKQEIQSYEDEIRKLQQELAAAGGATLRIATGNDPSAIASEIRSDAIRVLERQPVVQGIRNAIAELTDRLRQKQSQLEQLERQKIDQQRRERVQEGRAMLRSKITDVEKSAEELKNLYFELKELARQFEGDFAYIYPPTPVRRELNTASLLNFGLLTVPELSEADGRFLLKAKGFDLFAVEKEQARSEQLARSRAYRQNHQEMMAEIQRRERQQREQVEAAEREQVLVSKREQLKEAQQARKERLAALATANVAWFDSEIANLESEIESLQQSALVSETNQDG